MSVAFSVDGDPIPQGSLRAFVRGGRPILTYGRATSLGAWRESIAARCTEAMLDAPMIVGPVSLSLTFLVRRPRGHYGARGDVMPRFATREPVVMPDLDKLCRAALDALSGVAYRDDAQVVELAAAKTYAERPGLLVVITTPDPARPGPGVQARPAESESRSAPVALGGADLDMD